MYQLEVNNLSKIYTKRTFPFFGKKEETVVINDISFTLKKGEILGFLGPNGAGKTTTMQMLLGILTPSSGKITYFGKNFFQHRSEILKKVTFASSYIKLPDRLTVWQNLNVIGMLYGVPRIEREERINVLLTLLDIEKFRNKACGMLSAGQTTRLILAKAFLPNPEILLLDEPTASLDPDIAQEVREFIIKQVKERHISVLFTSHNMQEVAQICDRILVLYNGSIVANETPSMLVSQVRKPSVHLVIFQEMEKATAYAATEKLSYVCDGNLFSFEIDESNIGRALYQLGQIGVIYEKISIDKPTMEDYFLSIKKNFSSKGVK